MTNSIEDLCRELVGITSTIDQRMQCLENEAAKISDSMQNAQKNFGDQENGQMVVRLFYQTIQELNSAGTMLLRAGNTLKEYMQYIKR